MTKLAKIKKLITLKRQFNNVFVMFYCQRVVKADASESYARAMLTVDIGSMIRFLKLSFCSSLRFIRRVKHETGFTLFHPLYYVIWFDGMKLQLRYAI